MASGAYNFRAVVKYFLESSTGKYPYPRYKKTGVIRLGFHRSLTGGIASRPRLPQTNLARKVLFDYSSLPALSVKCASAIQPEVRFSMHFGFRSSRSVIPCQT